MTEREEARAIRQQRIYAPSTADGELRQGEIISDLTVHRLTLASVESGAEDEAAMITHPYAMIISQDCDLTQEYAGRPYDGPRAMPLPCVLLCEVYTAEDIKSPETPGMNGGIWKSVRKNNDVRYQFLEEIPPECDLLGSGLPELCLDFRRYFTVHTDELYARLGRAQASRRCRLVSPYLEHLCTRFAHYLSRVALPSPHMSN